MLKRVLFVLTIFIILSGCVAENNTTQLNESVNKGSVNIIPENLSSTTPSSEEENIPEIEVTSFSTIYMQDNSEIANGYFFNWENVPGNESQSFMSYLKRDLNIVWIDDAQIEKNNDNETIHVFTSENSMEFTLKNNKTEIMVTIDSRPWYDWEVRKENGEIHVYGPEKTYKLVNNTTEKHYLVYDLSIKNKGSKALDFRLSELQLLDGGQIFNTSILDPNGLYKRIYLEELLTSKKETKLEDTTLSPGQTINGSVVFRGNSLYNESFLLMYKGTPVPSASFKKSIKALRTVEGYNYSLVFGIPPYNNNNVYDSYKPDLEEYPYIWPNWVNRSVIEFFNKTDYESFCQERAKSSIDMPKTEATYALKVIPCRNITEKLERDKTSVPPINHFIVADDTGEELINTSRIDIISILKNQTFNIHSGENMDIPQMNFSNATIVKISYYNFFDYDRFSIIGQDIILDDNMNIVVARCYPSQGQS